MEYYSKHVCRIVLIPIILFILLVSNTTAIAQTITADSTRFPIGGKIILTIEVPVSEGDIVNWPVLNDTLTKSIEILSKSKIDTITNEETGQTILRQIVSITSFDTGFMVLPPLSFDLIKNGTLSQTFKTEPVLFEVVKVKVDPTSEIKDIKPIFKAPLTFIEVIPWLAGLLLLGLILYFGLYYLKKKKAAPVEKPQPKIKIPAWDVALKKLDLLKSEKIWERGDIKEYYTRLTDILREYFELRFNVNAAEMTSSEILDAMKKHINDQPAERYLQELLLLADMAKFAKAQPGVFENEQSIKYGYEIVNNTKPQSIDLKTIKENKPE
jgi:hypothetical protein